MAESADATDSKSVVLTGVWVQVPLRARCLRRSAASTPSRIRLRDTVATQARRGTLRDLKRERVERLARDLLPELKQRGHVVVPLAELEDDLWLGDVDDRRGAAELLAALAERDPVLLRGALLGEADDGNRGEELLRDAVEIAEDEEGD